MLEAGKLCAFGRDIVSHNWQWSVCMSTITRQEQKLRLFLNLTHDEAKIPSSKELRPSEKDLFSS